MKEITLGKSGLVALVDDEDFERVSQYSWCKMIVNNCIYARGNINNRRPLLHRFIMDILDKPHLIIDHANRNGLDNRKENLRFATNSQNIQNSRNRTGCSSKYKGVSFCKAKNKWQVAAKLNRKTYFLGRYDTEGKAALKYNEFAEKHYGEFARLNIIEEV